jgi:uncharacterized protein YigA (DUF484 family)
MSPQDVAEYLKSHPEFFDQHADLLQAVTLPHPHGGRAISLSERQMLALREKIKALELRLAELVRFGQENDAILERLQRWTRGLLLQRQARALPDALQNSLAEIFTVPQVALRIWDASDDFTDLAATRPVAPEVRTLADQLRLPYVGASAPAYALAIDLLDGPAVESIALLPLRRGAAPAAFGLLVLGSPDARRFHGGMGTEVLARIAETASAALTRLLS